MNRDYFRLFAMMGFSIIALIADIGATLHTGKSAMGWNMIFVAGIGMSLLFGVKQINTILRERGETA